MNWIELRALHQLLEFGEVSQNQTLTQSEVIRFLVNSLELLDSTPKKLKALDGYNTFYQTNYQAAFLQYESFLQENDLLKPQSRYDLSDIDILMKIKQGMDSGNLNEIREQIISSDESLKGVSLMFFKHEKYLLGKPSLVDALKRILKVEQFSTEKDQQYIYKLECHDPRLIVLCENLDFLTKPNKPRQFSIELWYAGGWNIQKLNYANARDLPIYYSCDWDLDGLHIYKLVKSIIPSIKLLYPTGTPRDLKATEHGSLWDTTTVLSGLPVKLFGEDQIRLIQKLIKDDKWIVEESNNLIEMLEKANVFK